MARRLIDPWVIVAALIVLVGSSTADAGLFFRPSEPVLLLRVRLFAVRLSAVRLFDVWMLDVWIFRLRMLVVRHAGKQLFVVRRDNCTHAADAGATSALR